MMRPEEAFTTTRDSKTTRPWWTAQHSGFCRRGDDMQPGPRRPGWRRGSERRRVHPQPSLSRRSGLARSGLGGDKPSRKLPSLRLKRHCAKVEPEPFRRAPAGDALGVKVERCENERSTHHQHHGGVRCPRCHALPQSPARDQPFEQSPNAEIKNAQYDNERAEPQTLDQKARKSVEPPGEMSQKVPTPGHDGYNQHRVDKNTDPFFLVFRFGIQSYSPLSGATAR